MEICPELEARMCLLDLPKKPKRRYSTTTVQPNEIKRRKISRTAQIILNENLNHIPLINASSNVSFNESIEDLPGQFDIDAPNLPFDALDGNNSKNHSHSLNVHSFAVEFNQ